MIAACLIVINLVTFIVYGIDKRRARMHSRRIPERTLMWLAVLGGSIGAYLAIHIFRHKTKHRKFMLGVPAIMVVQLAIAALFAMGII